MREADKRFGMRLSNLSGWAPKKELFPRSDVKVSGAVPLILETWFSSEAVSHLQSNGGVRSSSVGEAIPPLPHGASALMLAWWPIAGDASTPVPVWDSGFQRRPGGSNGYLAWPTLYAVTANSNATDFPEQMAFAGRFRNISEVISLEELIVQSVTTARAASLEKQTSANKLARMVMGRGFQAGDFLALVAMHVVQGDGTNGRWLTTWWQPDREPGMQTVSETGVLSNYQFDFTDDPVYPLETDGTPNRCFNPWLEGGLVSVDNSGNDTGTQTDNRTDTRTDTRTAGEDSNCLACHLRAGIPASGFTRVSRGYPKQEPTLSTGLLWAPALSHFEKQP